MTTGELIGAGRTADVYALDGEWVLRRYRDGGDARAEAALMAYLAGHGYPVPPVRPGGTPQELVLGRLTGPTMAEALLAGTLGGPAAGAMLAGLLRALHAVPPRSSSGGRLLHLDLHPENVFLTPDGPVVIDWATAQEGPPGLDTAMSALILAQTALTVPALGEAIHPILRALVRELGGTDGMLLDRARVRRAADPMLSAAETAVLNEAVALVRTV
ncbi:phosphotransferase [Kitasatospora sp. NPDC096147]|uniref:phosphotransferase n=1 Tax=Kitasatospora sp. NPDC096147 TaxID=3364093 RepID=UPI00381D2174